MLMIDDVLEKFRVTPRAGRADSPFRLVSSVASPAAADEIEAAWPARVPDEVMALWRTCRSARLFADTGYGQWGLALLDPRASRARTDTEGAARPQEFRSDDIVVGEFLGDQELLVFSPSEAGPRRVVIALPLDPRSEWFGVATSLVELLQSYFDAAGEKYWERLGK